TRRQGRRIPTPFGRPLLLAPSSSLAVPRLFRRGSICCSGLSQQDRARCSSLARWTGGKFSEDLSSEVGLLVAERVSLHPASKYQAALARRLPVVRLSYLEALWEMKAEVDVEPHILPPLYGLRICLDKRHEEYAGKAAELGAVVEAFDCAEVVVVGDIFAPLYQQARRIGILAASPLWLERCFQLRCCTPIAGELQVLNPRSAALAGGPTPGPGGCDDEECGAALLGCVLCLLYLPPGPQRDAAKALAWKVGAYTTLAPTDRAVTHVLFRVQPGGKAAVSVSVPDDHDRVAFIDVSWLEACACEGRRVSESQFQRQKVAYNPRCDDAHAAARALRPPADGEAPVRALKNAPSDPPARGAWSQPAAAPALPALCAPAAAPAAPAATTEPAAGTAGAPGGLRLGVFAGVAVALAGWQPGDPEARAMEEAVRAQGGAVLAQGLSAAGAASAVEHLSARRPPAALGTAHWVRACVADGVLYQRSEMPHFEPPRGQLPLQEMSTCNVRITALEASQRGRGRRVQLEKLVEIVGAKVADQNSRLGDITHVVCGVPGLLEGKTHASALRKKIPVVSVQWLFDCYRRCSRQLEDRYHVGPPQAQAPRFEESAAPAQSFASTVLAGHTVLISPAALGSEAQLPRMAEELGAAARTWRSAEELEACCRAAAGDRADGASGGQACAAMVVLLDREEAARPAGPLADLVSRLLSGHCVGPVGRRAFVTPAWLAEAFRQRRRLPLDAFAALPDSGDLESGPAKRPRLTGEAQYAWVAPEASRLEEFAESSRAQTLASKAQQKASEGLRLAELRGR
ncbi:unnamed protein product, partial [Prorocentrum cordatum]